jgi:type IV secretory pathway VirB4 component
MNYGVMRNLISSNLKDHTFKFIVIPDAGHHVYIDNAPYFNEAMKQALQKGNFDDLLIELKEYQSSSGPLRPVMR